ncbi:hypothetical protein ACS0TY_000623 [Phlomoides rotata]
MKRVTRDDERSYDGHIAGSLQFSSDTFVTNCKLRLQPILCIRNVMVVSKMKQAIGFSDNMACIFVAGNIFLCSSDSRICIQPNQTPENVVHIDANPNCSSRRLEKETLNTGSYSQQRSYHFKVDDQVSVKDYYLSPNADARGEDVECPHIPRITYMNLEDDTEVRRKPKRARKAGRAAQSPYTDPNNHIGKRQRKVKFDVSGSPKIDTKFGGYNPFEFLLSADGKNLMGWLNKKKKNNAKIKIPLKYLEKVNAQWFYLILSSRGLLSEENIDVLMQMILLKVCKSPEQWLCHWTMVDYIFWQDTLHMMYPSWADAKSKNLKWDWNTKSKTIMKYVNGDLPLERSDMPWSLMCKVYGIAHVNTNHWVLYQIEPCRGHVIVYDSMSRKEKDWQDDMKNKFNNLLLVLPSLFKDAREQNETSRLLASEERPWTLECFEHSPQQTNCHDCGIICVKIFECLISGRHIGCIDVKKCPNFRFSMCHDIFRHSGDYPVV